MLRRNDNSSYMLHKLSSCSRRVRGVSDNREARGCKHVVRNEIWEAVQSVQIGVVWGT